MLLLLRFGLCLPFQRRVPAKAVTPLYAGLGGQGRRHTALHPLSSLPWAEWT